MWIEAINVLLGQEAALRAPEETREAVYRERVDEPLRSFWEPAMRYMPKPSGDSEGGAPSGTVLLGFYGPDGDAGEGLEALAKFEEAGSFASCVGALEGAAEALAPGEHGVEVESVAFSLALADPRLPDLTERNRGYTGFGGMMGYAAVLAWPDGYNLARLPSISVHELHHNVRLAFEPWTPGTTVGQYVVLEGLAEAFAAEALGEELLGPWPNALSEEELEAARPVFRDALEVSGFDEIRGYVFGDWAASRMGYVPRGLPDFAGYAMGYRIVREYLERSGRTAAEATYAPWREIVDGSRYL
ncbi:MAG: DUF2268 domain-containing protein [Actinomycetota bacterium]|nr:DUF2268 domain-containing protein [Actinomycetota bacterium]PLS86758.1 MAG: hypothetical protein CYG60_05580 [Actinomycetota bacterium]